MMGKISIVAIHATLWCLVVVQVAKHDQLEKLQTWIFGGVHANMVPHFGCKTITMH
jgi:hypothetical protein